ncbi:MAG: molybdopterin/thiamine biosynthesis adenylyltransferase [Planctomycetota bacterium]
MKEGKAHTESGSTVVDSIRFDRQTRFAPLGVAGQARLGKARVLLVGCGATGGVLAQTLVRAGVGTLVLADRDIVEHSNLPRQVLFEDAHAEAGAPKATAAAEALARIGGPTQIDARITHVDAGNVSALAEGADLILDGTDNLPTRYLLNDLCVSTSRPWIYAGVVGAAGLVLPVLPALGPCLRCVFPEPPPPGVLPTCDSAGVILPAVGAVSSLAAGLALRILAAESPESWPQPKLIEIDVWNGVTRSLSADRDSACPACAKGEFPYLEAGETRTAAILCGRDTVQLPPLTDRGQQLDLAQLASRLRGQVDDLLQNPVFLRARQGSYTLTVFRDGRTLVEGTDDPNRAQSIFDGLIGR